MNSTWYDGALEFKSDLVKFMQDIIRIPSLSSQESAVIERIREEMERLDYDEVTVDPMGNLLGRIGHGPRVIALDGHVDTVDVGDPALWDRDPHSGDVEDGILYGRGSSDQKGGVASSVIFTVSTMPRTGSWSASRISSLVTTTFLGRPCLRSRPLTSIVISRFSGYALPMPILIFSAVCSPMSRL